MKMLPPTVAFFVLMRIYYTALNPIQYASAVSEASLPHQQPSSLPPANFAPESSYALHPPHPPPPQLPLPKLPPPYIVLERA